MKPLVTRVVILTSLALLSACSQDDAPRSLSPEAANLPVPAKLPDAGEFARYLPSQAFTQLSIATNEAAALKRSIDTLIATPTQATLNQARTHWRLSYSAYITALASSRLPVAEPPEWQSAHLTRRHLTEQLNSWPIEPGYIDYLDGYPFTGIVNDTTLTLSADNISSQHKFSDASYVSLGYPAIEFLLWGESGLRDSSDFDRSADQPPAAPALTTPIENNTPTENDTALDVDGSHNSTHSLTVTPKPHAKTVANQARRGEYLRIISDLLHQQLQRLQLRWEPESGYYANKVAQVSPEKVLQASLMTTQRLIREELLGHYLMNEGSSPFSAGNHQDVAAALSGLRELFLPKSTTAGLAPLLAQSVHTVKEIDASSQQIEDVNTTAGEPPANSPLARLKARLAPDSACGSGWQSADSHTASRQACRQQLLELLATLEEINTQLGMGLSSSH
jgi:putative iron-regulated protein